MQSLLPEHCTMKLLLACFAIGLFACLSSGKPQMQDGEGSNKYAYIDDIVDDFKAAKRQVVNPSACMAWGLPCIPESQYRFARCCPGYVCACNIWNTACKCRSRLG
ncbi:uncharacterized protein LOC111101495 [Crassostrea virginica]|uniref:Uncharacterized protein LOC111101495 n=1 Tax=Crassostrea virginica TaxID=6565 RepID=A0A8B8AGS1_CRAVI|nr:uncharacterized protein LOC111101495 [Crassostrea virginica]